MRYVSLGPFEHISRLTLGGGGLGQGWGETTQDEAIATVHAAVDAGITLIDTAPLYLHCESVIADAFESRLPEGVRITSKCRLGEPPAGQAAGLIEASLDASLKAMRLDHVDVLFLHTNVCEDDAVYTFGNDRRAEFATPWNLYTEEVAPAFEALKEKGRIGAWGISAIEVPSTLIKALNHEVRPQIIQAISNLLDSAGALRRHAEPSRPREIIAEAKARGIGVLGIRAVQAGALTAAMDRPVKSTHPDGADFLKAAPFRELCGELKLNPAQVAHRYALDMEGVDTVVLGVKNRMELAECVEAEAMGPLPDDLRSMIDGLGLASSG
jgi:aryl-alcohol dehydrogenase-like predicted oxidoreductase